MSQPQAIEYLAMLVIGLFFTAAIVGLIRAFVLAIRAYRVTRARGARTEVAAIGAVLLGVIVATTMIPGAFFFRGRPRPAPAATPDPVGPPPRVIDPRPPLPEKLTVTVTASPEGSLVYLQGALVGEAPVTREVTLDPSDERWRDLEVDVRKPGYLGAHFVAIGSRGMEPQQRFEARLQRSDKPLVHLSSEPPGARVLGTYAPREALTPIDVELPFEGTFVFQLEREGSLPAQSVVKVARGEERVVRVPLRPGAMVEVAVEAGDEVYVEGFVRRVSDGRDGSIESMRPLEGRRATIEPNTSPMVTLQLPNGQRLTKRVRVGEAGSVTRVVFE